MNTITFAVVTTLLVFSFQSRAADCSATTNTYSKAFTPNSISIGRNTPPGTVVSTASNVTGGASNITCITGNGPKKWMMIRYGNTMTPITGAGIPAGVYETNVNGIGVLVKETMSGTNNFSVSSDLQQWYSPPGGINGGHFITGLDMSLIVTGPVTPGTITFPIPFVESWAGPTTANTNDAANYNTINMGNITVIVKSCETPDITVNLGEHHRSDFSGINSTSPAKQFNFEIKNCDPGLNSVNYTFKPVTALQQSGTANQYITLDASSTASGVGIQVLYNDGTIVPFNSKIKYTGYSKTAGGSYVIPMKARYIQTAGTIGGGTANSAVEFTMSYE